MNKTFLRFAMLLYCITSTFHLDCVSVIEPKNREVHEPLSLESAAEVYCLAQSAEWLNDTAIAVGRWDGSISIFNYEKKLNIVQAIVPPHGAPITALAKIDEKEFISSDGETCFAHWVQGQNQSYQLMATYHFDECYGSVDSAVFVRGPQGSNLITGHSNGYLLVWSYVNMTFYLEASIDLQSNNPVSSPYPLWNVRKIIPWNRDCVITASEDGDICMVNFLNRKIIHRQKFHAGAQRGINDIALANDLLLLSNCSVGPSDKNLWLYKIEASGFIYLDSINLIADQSKEQVFSFHVGLFSKGANHYFVCSTGEGLLWYGIIKENKFGSAYFKKNSLRGGAALAVHPTRNYCASVNYDLSVMKIGISE